MSRDWSEEVAIDAYTKKLEAKVRALEIENAELRDEIATLKAEEEPEVPDHVRFLNSLRPYRQKR